jgi:hypothetical protein
MKFLLTALNNQRWVERERKGSLSVFKVMPLLTCKEHGRPGEIPDFLIRGLRFECGTSAALVRVGIPAQTLAHGFVSTWKRSFTFTRAPPAVIYVETASLYDIQSDSIDLRRKFCCV